jgi:cardiolipin synthase A/B
MEAEILVDAAEFWPRLKADLSAARRRIYVQTLSFEGDDAGLALAAALRQASAPDRRVVVDAYTKYVISDRLIHSPANRADRGLRAEVQATRGMMRDLKGDGVGVKFSNPMGRFLARFPARNHKKLIVVDDIAYVGGINFSDHNFAWHDFMLRLLDARLAARLAEDFRETWSGRNGRWTAEFDGLRLWSFDGVSNPQDFQFVFDLIHAARQEILIESPYLTFPFFGPLRAAVQRGVTVRLIAPRVNNKPIMDAYIRRQTAQSGMHLHLYPDRMIHLKAMLVDGRRLLIGSANFDFVSFRGEQELLALVSDPAIVQSFRERILLPDLARAPLHRGRHLPLSGALQAGQLWLADRVVVGLDRLTRGQAVSVSTDP